jgi:hypothetical protein
LKKGRRVTGNIQRITPSQLEFVTGTIYKIDARADFAELRYRGSFVIESTSVHYPFTAFGTPWSGQGLGNLRSLRDLLNPTAPLASLSGVSQERQGEVHTHIYDAEVEIHLSCRIEAGKTEIEVDDVNPLNIVARQ